MTFKTDDWRAYLRSCRRVVQSTPLWAVKGRLIRVTGMVMEAVGIRLPVGSACQVELSGGQIVEAEVVGFASDRIFLMPVSNVQGLLPGTPVMPFLPVYPPIYAPDAVAAVPSSAQGRQVPVGHKLLGRILDSLGRPLDGKGALEVDDFYPLYSAPLNPLDRTPVHDVLDVGVRTINGLLTVGRGQRLGLFAGSGVGKSVLLGMMARFTKADIVIVGLIGERGREVRDFIENILGEEGLARSVVVAAPADMPPLMRLHGAAYATALAEYFRDQGLDVLLLMDSVTRYAMAQREIALAIGEPPVTKGYPPSVFAKLPQLIERAGNGPEGGGSITAFYTVLSEGDDQQDPIADSARAILDGHFVLSRQIAESGVYPAIDIEQSISRVMNDIVTPEQLKTARRFKQLYSSYARSRDLINVGAYVSGSDRQLDAAIELYPAMQAYLMQEMKESYSYDESSRQLAQLISHAME